MPEFFLALIFGVWLTILMVMLGGVIIFFKLLVGLLGWWVLWLPVTVVILVVAIFIYLWKESH